MPAIGEIRVDVLADLTKFSKGIADAKSQIDSLTKSVNAIKGVALAGAGIFAGLTGLNGLSTLFHNTVGFAAEAERAQVSFEVMLGDVQKAATLLKDIRQFAATSPYTTKDVTSESRNLITAGVKSEQAVPTVKMLGDVAGGDAEKLRRITLAYTQVRTLGQMNSRDLLQFNDAGVPMVEHLAKAMGKAEPLMKQMIEDGKIGFPQVQQAFRLMTDEGGRFHNMSDKFGDTYLGRIEQLKDSLQSLGREVGAIIIEEADLKGMAASAMAFVNNIRTGTGEIRPLVHLIGQAAKGTAQFAYEMGRFVVFVGESAIEKFTKMIPDLGNAGSLLKQIFTDLENFKLDEEKFTALADMIVEIFTFAFAEAGDVFSGWWKSAQVEFIAPMKAALADLKYTTESIKAVKNAVRDAPGGLADYLSSYLSSTPAHDMKMLAPVKTTDRVPGIDPDQAVRYTQLQADLKAAESMKRADVVSQSLYLFKKEQIEGELAEIRRVASLTPAAKEAAKNIAADKLRGKPEPESPVRVGWREKRAVERDAARRSAALRTEAAARNQTTFGSIGGAFGAVEMEKLAARAAGQNAQGGAFGGLMSSARDAAENLQKLAKVEIEFGFTGNALESIRSANKLEHLGPNYDLMGEFKRDILSIKAGFDLPNGHKDKIDRKTMNFAMADVLDRTTKHADLQFKNPGLAEYGSQEAAQAQIKGLGGSPDSRDPASLLKSIDDRMKDKAIEDAKTVDRLMNFFGGLLKPEAVKGAPNRSN